MKIVKILSAFAAVCALVIGCVKETPNVYDEIQVSSSYVGLTNNEGTNSETITVTAKDSWSINSIPEWLTITPASGNAGETSVTFAAEKAGATREETVKLVCAGKTQRINVRQEAEKVEPATLTVAEAIELINQDPNSNTPTTRVKGIVCQIVDISASYGNATFWISDNGKYETGKVLEVYRAAWLDNVPVKAGDSVDLGDEVIVEGNLMSYKGTPETVEKQAFVYKINRSLIKCDSLVFNGAKLASLPIEGGNFDAKLTCKGDGVTVNIPEEAKAWLSVVGIKTSGSTATITFNAAQNEGGDRTTDLTFLTSSEGKDYTASASVTQKGAIIACTVKEFNEAEVGTTVYRLSGIIGKVDDASKGNFHFQDFSGETYAYKATNIADYSGIKVGDIVTITGTRGQFGETIELMNGVIEDVKSVTTMTAAEAIALADDDASDPKNYFMLTGKVTNGSASGHKFDLKTYGNFDLVDESGAAYVYGVSTGWNGETKKFGTLGVEEGDIITIVGYKTSYTSSGKTTDEIVGMYVSHEKGETPEEPDYGDDIVLTIDDMPTAYPTEATTYSINGYDVSILNVANFGNGIQMKKNGGYIATLTAAKRAIETVRVDAYMAKYTENAWDSTNLKLYAKTAADAQEVAIEGVKDDTGVTYTLSAANGYKFFTLKNEDSYAIYLDKIQASVAAE